MFNPKEIHGINIRKNDEIEAMKIRLHKVRFVDFSLHVCARSPRNTSCGILSFRRMTF